MRKGDTYFVRVDKKIGEKKVDKNTFDEHLEYIKKLATEIELYAGGFAGVSGGMIVFKARNLEEADFLCKKDPIVERSYYSYELQQWELLITSDQAL
ncbi:MAG: hypothetical protein HQM08_07005 [Candidatus Riflebacteria bacterium]|nr:hypothetical protein [Candidatus Riflebacteria bacterium]